MIKRDQLYLYAKTCLGKDMSFTAPDELGCADAVNEIARRAIGRPIGGGVSTTRMYETLKRQSWLSYLWRFAHISLVQARPGDIIISPTGYGGANGVTNGHVGIISDNGRIMSNNSLTGKWDEHYTISTWIDRYKRSGGYPVEIFRVIR